MHGSARNSLLAALASCPMRVAMLVAMLIPVTGHAGTSGVYLPSAPGGSGGEDSIETSSGTRCRQSMNNNGTYLDVGMTGSAASPNRMSGFSYNDSRDKEAMAYVRMTIPIGRKPDRIDCSKIYELELDKLRREVELLRMGVK